MKYNFENMGTAPGTKCFTSSCMSTATHYDTWYKRWRCYHCSFQINGKEKMKRCISGADYTYQILTGEIS